MPGPTLVAQSKCLSDAVTLQCGPWFAGPFAWMQSNSTVTISGISAGALADYITGTSKGVGLAVVDCRMPAEADGIQIKGAYHLAAPDRNHVQVGLETLAGLSQKNAPLLLKLLEMDYVVFHCRAGANRTPAMASAYLLATRNNAKKKVGQKVVLLFLGMNQDNVTTFTTKKLLETFKTGPIKKVSTVQPTQPAGDAQPAPGRNDTDEDGSAQVPLDSVVAAKMALWQ